MPKTAVSIIIMTFILFLSPLYSADEPSAEADYPSVVFKEKKLFQIYSDLGPFSKTERAAAISARLSDIEKSGSFSPGDMAVVKGEFTTDIIYKEKTILSITKEDADISGKTGEELASEYLSLLKESFKDITGIAVIKKPSDIYTFIVNNRTNIIKGGIAILLFILQIILIYLVGKGFKKLYAKTESAKGTFFKTIHIKDHELITDETIVSTTVLLLRGLRLFISLIVVYLFIDAMFLLFPTSKAEGIKDILWGLVLTVVTTAFGYGLFKTVKLLTLILSKNINEWKGTFITPLVLKNITLLTEDQIVMLLQRLVSFFNFVLNIFLLYIFIPVVFSYFSFTKTWADTLFGWVLSPLKSVVSTFVSYIPSLIFIAVIILINRYVIRLSRLFFDEVEKGNIDLPGFYPEWADPTHKIVRFMIIIFTLVVVYPYLPGSDSEAFKGISIFLGVLFSLGSTSVIANMVAGIILTYMYAFKTGDRVKIGDTSGEVIEKTLLVTRIKTVKNIVVTIPNSSVLSGHIINYSLLASEKGLILHTSVTIGYDVPWRDVHNALLESASRCGDDIKKEPPPFVLQTALNDYYVAYELNVYTDRADKMAAIYSEIHGNIQDVFNEKGIEILSPAYSALRDGNHCAIPENYLPENYTVPGFIVNQLTKRGKTGK